MALIAAAWVALVAVLYACSSSTGARTAPDPRADDLIPYVPIDNSTFVHEAVIDAWIERPSGPDLDSIWGHGWDLWRAINAPSGYSLNGTPLPVWETWYSDEEAFLDNQDALAASRDFDPLAQSFHAGALRNAHDTDVPLPAASLTFNRFNRPMFDAIQENRYYDRQVLQALANGFDAAGTPPALRSVMEFPNTSVMLKPVWFVVPGDRPSMLPYWAGDAPDVAADVDNPTWGTWKQCVLVDPTGTATPDEDRVCNAGNPGETPAPARSYAVKQLSTDPAASDFYAFRITQEEVDSFGQFKMLFDNTNKEGKVEEIEAGDYAVLLAMHTSTREIEDWTWQTFWWVPDPTTVVATPPHAQRAPSSIPAPFRSFHMCSAYFMTTPPDAGPAGEPWTCFNPYLESDLTDLYSADRSVDDQVGKQSNCMTCHRVAKFSAASKVEYAASGYVDKSDPAWFADGVITEFSWAMAFRNHAGPFVGPTPPTTSGG